MGESLSPVFHRSHWSWFPGKPHSRTTCHRPSMKVDVYSMLDGWIVDRMADDISEALAKNGYDVSCVSWDIVCNVHDLDEDLWHLANWTFLQQFVTKPPYRGFFIGILKESTRNTSMRKIEQQMNSAINAKITWSKGNTRVDRMGNRSEVYLHNNHIATCFDNGDLQLSSAGWETVTTKSRLNAILENFFGYTLRIFQHNFDWYIGDRNNPFFDGYVIHRWSHTGSPLTPFFFTLTLNPNASLHCVTHERRTFVVCFVALCKEVCWNGVEML